MRDIIAAKTLNELNISDSVTINSVVRRNSNGDINTRLFRSTHPDQTTMSGGLVYRVNNSTDNSFKTCNSPSAIRSWLDVPTTSHNHDTAYLAKTGTASAASKLATARKISITGSVTGEVSFNGTADVSITSTIKGVSLDSTFKDNFRTLTKGDANNGTFIAVTRQEDSNVENSPRFGVGLAFGKSDTHMYIATSYGGANAYIGAGSTDKLNWLKPIAFADHNHDTDYLAKTGTASNASKLNNCTENSGVVANSIAKRDANADIYARLFRCTYKDLETMSGAIAYRIDADTTNHIRFCNTPTAVTKWLGTTNTSYKLVGTANSVSIPIPNASANFVRVTFHCVKPTKQSTISFSVNDKYLGDWVVIEDFGVQVDIVKTSTSSYIMTIIMSCDSRNSTAGLENDTSSYTISASTLTSLKIANLDSTINFQNCAYVLEYF